MNPNTFVPSFYFYKLADAISSPYTSLMAYQAGNIDANGNITNSISSIDPFEYLVIKLKQIFDQLPYGITKAKLSNYMATLQMFGEEVEKYEISQEQFHCLVEGIVSQNTNNEVSYLELLEDMATGGGAGAIGVPAEGGNINQGGVSGFDPRMGLPIMRRKKEQYFDNCEIFDVCPEEYSSFKNAKSWKDVPESETKNYLRRFQRRNRNAKIGVKGLNPLNGETELHWITYPAKNFMEEVDLTNLNFLFEEKEKTKKGIERGKKTQQKSRTLHDSLKNYLIGRGLKQFDFPSPDIRNDPTKLEQYHTSMPHGHFYVSDNPDEGGGSDSFIKIDDKVYGGLELKGSSLNKRNRFEVTPPNVGGLKKKSKRAVTIASKLRKTIGQDESKNPITEPILSDRQSKELEKSSESFFETQKGQLKDIFRLGDKSKTKKLRKKITTQSSKEIEKKGEVYIIGSPESGGLHALTTVENENDPHHDRQIKLINAIGLKPTGKLSDWGNPYGTRWINRSLKTRLEIKPPTEEHEVHPSYKENSKIFNLE